MFRDRAEAGKMLARKLETLAGNDATVLALPRGGVVLGTEVAQHLGATLDVIVSRKIGHPALPEYAIGAVNEKGMRVLNEGEAAALDRKWLEEETRRQQEEAQRRVALYRSDRPAATLAGKTAVLVDDGLATGLTMQLAVRSAKAAGASRVIVAVPVAPKDAANMLRGEGAEIVTLEPFDELGGAVGAHYERFEQVEDDEVIRLLHTAWNRT